jgi:hypothetical protein
MKPVGEMSFGELVDTLTVLEHEQGEDDLERTILRDRLMRRLTRILCESPADPDRRGALRVRERLEVKLHAGEREVQATLVDLSESGVRVTCNHAPPEWDAVDVELPLKSGQRSARARARVSWKKPLEGGCELGLQFLGQTEGHKTRMRFLVLEILRRMPLPS